MFSRSGVVQTPDLENMKEGHLVPLQSNTTTRPQDSAALAGLPLRDYQHEAVEAVFAAQAAGTRRQLLLLPTGTGKTVVFDAVIERVLHQTGGRALVLAHRDELLSQAQAKLRAVAPRLRSGIVRAERDEHDAQVVIASVQTLIRPARLARLGTDFDVVVIDEAHHAAADSYTFILRQLGAFDDDGPLLLGVTATADRGDGQGLDGVFESIVYLSLIHI